MPPIGSRLAVDLLVPCIPALPIGNPCMSTSRRVSIIRDLVLYVLTCIGLVWLVLRGAEQLGYQWHWRQVAHHLIVMGDGSLTAGPLIRGLLVTMEITLVSLVLAGGIGLTVALLRLSSSRLGRCAARVYLESIRNTPLLVQIFFFYFVVAPLFDIGRTTTAILALSLFEGAYVSEIIRAGIISIGRGQWEACYSLGLSRTQSYRAVILPQALRRILPPLTSQAVSLIKDSALVSTIAVYDVTMAGRTIVADTFLVFEVWFVVAALYLTLTLSLSALASRLERRFPRVA